LGAEGKQPRIEKNTADRKTRTHGGFQEQRRNPRSKELRPTTGDKNRSQRPITDYFETIYLLLWFEWLKFSYFKARLLSILVI
jgi:hypothetical protein